MKKLILLITVILLFVSCKTTKQATTSGTAVKKDSVTAVEQHTVVDSTKTVVDKTGMITITSEDITIVDMSKPDSSGKQFPDKVTKISRVTTSGKQNDIKVTKTVSGKSDYKSGTQVKTAEKTNKTDKVEKRWTVPAWLTWLEWAAGFIALFILSFYLYPGWIGKLLKWILKLFKG